MAGEDAAARRHFEAGIGRERTVRIEVLGPLRLQDDGAGRVVPRYLLALGYDEAVALSASP